MNIKQIRALHLLVKTGSVSATARIMHLSQPAVSKMIRSLEAEIGVSLLNHVRGKIEPRPELKALMPSIERITNELGDLKALTDDLRTGLSGFLAISCSLTVGLTLVLPACRSLLARTSGVQTTLIHRGGRFSLEDVVANRVDLAVEQLLPTKANLVSRAVARGHMMCVVPKGHPFRRKPEVRAEDLHGQRVILYPPKTINGARVHAQLRECNIACEPVFLTDSAVLACRLATDLSVPAIVDSLMDVCGLFPSLEVKPFVPRFDFELHAIWKAQNARTALAALVDELAAVGRQLQ
jgi:DNA-binding transcriptional LysR family regulator